MLVAPLVRNDVHSLLATRKPVAYKRKEYAILFVIAREKCADVPHRSQLRASERNRLYRPHQTQSPSSESLGKQTEGNASAQRTLLPSAFHRSSQENSRRQCKDFWGPESRASRRSA